MAKIRKIDWSFDEWIAGTVGMTLEEEGLYARIINRIYSRGGDFPSDPVEIARLCGVRVQIVRRLMPKLAKKFEETGGKLRSNRCETELKLARNRLKSSINNGKKGGRPRTYKNRPVLETEKLSPPHTTHQDSDSSLRSESEREASAREIAELMLEVWIEESVPAGLAKPMRLTPARIAACAARWRDSFGSDRDQWRAHLVRIRASPGLLGANERGWKADLDWALRPASILGVAEGKYDTWGAAPRANGHASPAPPNPAPEDETQWEDRIGFFRSMGRWLAETWGPPPDQRGCRAPPHLMRKFGYAA